MDKKINVLVLPSDRTGVSKFRSIEPHLKLQELYGEQFHVDIIIAGSTDLDWDDISFVKKYDIIHFHRTLPIVQNGVSRQVYLEEFNQLHDKLKSYGIITIMDLDDYWAPTKDHPAYQLIVNDNLPHKIKENIKRVDYVTTTTSIFAKEISKLNKNVIVLPNAIDPSEKQFTPKPEETNKLLRYGWLGGSSHLYDLKLMGPNVSQFLKENIEDTQFVLCGFDTRGTVTEIDKDTGQTKGRKIKPEESVWSRYEELFTDNYKILEEDTFNNLKRYDRDFDESSNYNQKIYRRVWTKNITTYASNYNLFDVSMAPLKEHDFNRCKSQLKVIEAGFHKKALIAQNYGPYQIDCVNLIEYGGKINENGNAILVDTHKNHKDWYKAMKKLKDNPTLVELLSNNLFETVNSKYHINIVTENRKIFYQSLMKDNKKEVEQLIEETNAF
jgi:glycosyltransferase involved in cell wall biosynthesis